MGTARTQLEDAARVLCLPGDKECENAMMKIVLELEQLAEPQPEVLSKLGKRKGKMWLGADGNFVQDKADLVDEVNTRMLGIVQKLQDLAGNADLPQPSRRSALGKMIKSIEKFTESKTKSLPAYAASELELQRLRQRKPAEKQQTFGDVVQALLDPRERVKSQNEAPIFDRLKEKRLREWQKRQF